MEPGGFVDFLANGLQGLLLAYFYWRLKIKVYARWTAWGMYTILILGFWFVAVPRSFQIDWLTGYQPLIRFTIFAISAGYCLWDLRIYLRMSKEQRAEESDYPKEKYVKREHYDELVAQLAAIETLKREAEKKQDEL